MTINHTFDGTTWAIPTDLIRTQRDWDAANQACSAALKAGDPDMIRTARARLLELTLDLYRDPWLIEMQSEGRRYAADLAIKDLARGAATVSA